MFRSTTVLALIASIGFFSLFPLEVYAQSPSPTASPAAASSPVASPTPVPASSAVSQINSAVSQLQSSPLIDVGQFTQDVLLTIQSYGGLTGAMKIVCGILLLLALSKVSADGKIPLLSSLWPQSSAVQSWMAPILGLVLGILMLGSQGAITLAGVLTYVGTGAGAIALHEILDTVKAIPGLGAVYVSIINVIEGVLGGSSVKA